MEGKTSHQAKSMITDYVLHDENSAQTSTDFRHPNLFPYQGDYEIAFSSSALRL